MAPDRRFSWAGEPVRTIMVRSITVDRQDGCDPRDGNS